MRRFFSLLCVGVGWCFGPFSTCLGQVPAVPALSNLLAGSFTWTVASPLASPASRPADPCMSVKDPSIVQFDGRWHIFSTIRSKVRTHQIEYISFADWKDANSANRHVLKCCDGYFCAPQVFRFSRDGRWYLVYQAPDETKKEIRPVYSTTTNLVDPYSWGKPIPFYAQRPANVKGWIDFWVIADDAKAYLFFTSLDGRMWRAETKLADFPGGWGEPKVVLQADILEAAHVYALKGLKKYLALIEAQADGRRYYKAYISDSLDGSWQGLADTRQKPFASPVNVRDTAAHWTDSFSHGELLREGCDEKLEVNPNRLRFLFQGVSDERRQGKAYGEIPWQLGLLEPGE
ncbi:MAG TPA: non-reducing end alpha-L-arabinofuranosidase family hydrolase [Verrucomicrobiae bacterium]